MIFVRPTSTGQTAPPTEDRIYLVDNAGRYVRVVNTSGQYQSAASFSMGALGGSSPQYYGIGVTDSRIYVVEDTYNYVRVWNRSGQRVAAEDVNLGSGVWRDIHITDTRIYIVDSTGTASPAIKAWDRSWNRQSSEDITMSRSRLELGALAGTATRLYLGSRFTEARNCTPGVAWYFLSRLWAYDYTGTAHTGDDIHYQASRNCSRDSTGVRLIYGGSHNAGVLYLAESSGTNLLRYNLSSSSFTTPLSVGYSARGVYYASGASGNVGNAQFDLKGGLESGAQRDWGIPLPTSTSVVTIADHASIRYSGGFHATYDPADIGTTTSTATHTLVSHGAFTLSLTTSSAADTIGTVSLRLQSGSNVSTPWSASDAAQGLSFGYDSSTGSLYVQIGTNPRVSQTAFQSFNMSGAIRLFGGPSQEVQSFSIARALGSPRDVDLRFDPGDSYYTRTSAGTSSGTTLYGGYIADRSPTPLAAGAVTWEWPNNPNPASGLMAQTGALSLESARLIPTASASLTGLALPDPLDIPTVTPAEGDDSAFVKPLRDAAEASGLPANAWWLALAIGIGVIITSGAYRVMPSLWVSVGLGLLVMIGVASIAGTFGLWIIVVYVIGAMTILSIKQWGQ